MQAAAICPMTVAVAAPATSILGQPNHPKIMIGSRIRLMMAPAICENILSSVFPVDCNRRSQVICKKQPMDKTATIRV